MFKNTFLVMIINFTSRILGLIREILLAYFYGGSGLTDAYFASSKFSNFFTTFFADGGINSSFKPIYNDIVNERGKEHADEFMQSIINLVFHITLTTAILTIIFSKPILVYIIGFKDYERIELANNLLKIMAFNLVFISISSLLAAYLNSYKKFFLSSLSGVIFNLSIIFGLVLTRNNIGIYGLAIAFTLSGLFQIFIQLPMFLKLIKKYKFKINLKDKYIKEFFILTIPTILSLFAYQINEFIDMSFAAHLRTGTISAINYASRLYLLPIGVFSISLNVVVFPYLTDTVTNKKKELEKELFTKGFNLLTFFMIPSAIVLFFYPEEIISFLFGYGKFNQNNIVMTAQILRCYAIGIYFFGLNHLLNRIHHAHKEKYIPLYASIISIILNITLDYLLYIRYEHVGLTVATVISSAINFLILIISVKINYIDFKLKKYIMFLLKVIISAIIALIVSKVFNYILIKLIVFSIIYLLFWAYEFYNKKLEIFN